MHGFEGRSGFALATLLLCAFAPRDAQAATQCINAGVPAPLEFCVTDVGRPSAYVFQPNNARVRQYFGSTPSWGSIIWLNGANTAGRYSTGYKGSPTLLTAVSNVLTGTGSASSPWIITNVTNLGISGVQLTQTFRYVDGDRTIRKTFTIANNGATPYNDLRFIHGGDTFFGGVDNARSWYDTINKMVYVTNPAFTNTGYMGFYANPATPSSAYFGGLYSTGDTQAGNTAQLNSTADANFVDAGYYLQWNRASLTPGQTWSIDSYEVWSPPGAVQVISPASDYVSPGTTVTRTFRVQNLSAGPLTIGLSVAATPDSWTATLQGANSILVSSLEIVDVLVDIVVPPGAAPGATQDVTLSAVATTNTGVGATRLSILQVDYAIAPDPLAFGTVTLGSSSDLSITLTNGAAAAAVQLGTVAAANPLTAPFSIIADTCSNMTVGAAGTCVVTVRFTPTLISSSNDSFSIPITSPVITTQTIAVSGTGSLIASFMVTATAGVGGGMAPTSHTVTSGSTTAFTLTPDAGYGIADGTGCGGSLAGNTYTTAAITADCTVSAAFSPVSYPVTAGAAAGGGISPASASVAYGSTTSFNVTANAGFSIAAVSGCAGSLDGGTYTTGQVTGACAVSATFAVHNYTVTASAGANGSILPASVSVDHGATASFTLTPAAGYSAATVTGCGGSRIGNTYTTGIVTGACAVSASFGLSGPVFIPAAPATINLASTGLTTLLPADARPSAVDLARTALAVTLVGGKTSFAPGAYTLVWRAVDSSGVEGTVEQILHVWPIVSLSDDFSIGHVAGNSGSFRIALNGVVPVYPFDVSYGVSGYLQDHDLESGVAQFASGEVEKEVFLAITASAAAGVPSQRIDVALDDASINRGVRHELSITLLTANAPASVNVRGGQEAESRPVFTRDASLPVTLHVDIDDPNSGDAHTVAWSGPPGAVFTIVNGELVLDSMSLPAGVHQFVVTVSDNGSPAASTTLRFDIVLAMAAAVLPAGSAGWMESGLPANPAYSPATRNVLPGQAQDLEHGLLEAEPGVQLALGSRARDQALSQAQLSGTSLGSLALDDVVNSGGIFDFRVFPLPKVGQSTSITIAQTAPIGAHAVYRIYDPDSRTWRSFVPGPNDVIASAPSVGGACPPPGSVEYQPGLAPGDACVSLKISDGGPNDADKGINGSISSLGGVAAMNEVTVTANGSGRRGGAIDVGFLVFGFGVLALRWLLRRRLGLSPELLVACVLPALASAGEVSRWYVGGQYGAARSNASEGDMNRKLAEEGYDVKVDFEDTSREAWKLFGGYRFSAFVGLQLGYTNLGQVDSRLSGSIIDVDQLLTDVTRMHPHSADGIEGTLKMHFPLAARLAATGSVGAFRWDSTYRAFNSEGEEFARSEDSGTDLVLSAGLAWKATEQLDLSADISRYDIDGEKISVIGLGAVWNFASL